MKKEIKKKLIITSIITALPILVGVFLWNRLPDTIATHFGSDGEPNGWSSKWFTVFGLPLILVAVNIICTIGTETDPKRHKYPEKMMKLIYGICPVVSLVVMTMVYSEALGYEVKNFPQFLTLFVGVVFILIGNYMPKVKQNYYLGIKLPWTYADEDNWNKTHRLGGKVWMICGALLVCNFFLRIKGLEVAVLLAAVLIPAIFSFVYSLKKIKKSE